jgi:hypothetical protein
LWQDAGLFGAQAGRIPAVTVRVCKNSHRMVVVAPEASPHADSAVARGVSARSGLPSVTLAKDPDHFGRWHVPFREQHQDVVQQVGGLAGERVPGAR